MRVAILVEGKTETAFKPYLLTHLQKRLAGRMPKLDFVRHDGRIPTGDKLKRVVENLLNDKKQPANAVIALTDVYTGSNPPEFPTAEACASGEPLLAAHAKIAAWPKGGEPWAEWRDRATVGSRTGGGSWPDRSGVVWRSGRSAGLRV